MAAPQDDGQDELQSIELLGAAEAGDVEVILSLLTDRANVNYVGPPQTWGATPLHIAASNTWGARAIPLLLAKKANIQLMDVEGETPLSTAIMKDVNAAAEFLLGAGGGVDRALLEGGGCSLDVIARWELRANDAEYLAQLNTRLAAAQAPVPHGGEDPTIPPKVVTESVPMQIEIYLKDGGSMQVC